MILWGVTMAKQYMIKSPYICITPSVDSDRWESDWIILHRKEKNKPIGRVTFAGEKIMGSIPINLELDEPYRNKGYGTEVLKLMVEWAMSYRNIYEVVAVTEHENDKCICALEKAGFVFREEQGGIETYSITKPKTTWAGLYMLIGIIIGMIIGIVFENFGVGMAVGILAAVSIGVPMDMKEVKDREQVTGTKEQKAGTGKKK